MPRVWCLKIKNCTHQQRIITQSRASNTFEGRTYQKHSPPFFDGRSPAIVGCSESFQSTTFWNSAFQHEEQAVFQTGQDFPDSECMMTSWSFGNLIETWLFSPKIMKLMKHIMITSRYYRIMAVNNGQHNWQWWITMIFNHIIPMVVHDQE